MMNLKRDSSVNTKNLLLVKRLLTTKLERNTKTSNREQYLAKRLKALIRYLTRVSLYKELPVLSILTIFHLHKVTNLGVKFLQDII